MDLFEWSIPFVAEKAVNIFAYFIAHQFSETKNLEDFDKIDWKNVLKDVEPNRDRREVLRIKIRAVAKHLSILRLMREEKETLLKIKEMSPDGCIPRGLLLEGK